MSKIIENVYKYIAYICIIFMLVIINFNNFTRYGLKENIIQLLFILSCIGIFVVLNKFILNKIGKKGNIAIIISILIIFFFLEIISVCSFKVERNWDFKWIMDTAEDFVNTGSTDNLYYFQIFPNNIGALAILTVAMKITLGNEIGAYIVNVIFVFLAAIFSMLSAKKIGGYKLAMNTLLIMLLCAPMYLYTPIVYTDTLSVFIPVATLYVWLIAKENRNCKKKYICWGILAILAVLGYSLKPVAMIVYVAIILDTILTNRRYLKHLAVSFFIFILLFVGYTKAENMIIIKDSPWTYPYTHWIMMGLNKPENEGGTSIGWGAYSAEDNAYTGQVYTVEAKKQANLVKIKERLNNFGINGYVEFLYNKFKYVWNDGTYYVFNKIGWDTINKDGILYDYIIGEKSELIIKPYLNYLHEVIMLMILIALIINVRNGEDGNIRVMATSMVGIAIFLLFWEARSRYIYFMIPIFCILAAWGICKISENKLKMISSGIKGERENEK